jgi:hypothetical protein
MHAGANVSFYQKLKNIDVTMVKILELLVLDNPQPSFKMYILKKVQRLDGYRLVKIQA